MLRYPPSMAVVHGGGVLVNPSVYIQPLHDFRLAANCQQNFTEHSVVCVMLEYFFLICLGDYTGARQGLKFLRSRKSEFLGFCHHAKNTKVEPEKLF